MKTNLFTKIRRRYAVNLQILCTSLLFLVLMLFVSYAAEAQMHPDSGAVKVTVLDKSNSEAIPFANVVAYQNGVQVAVATTNMDGEGIFRKLASGKYDIKAVYVGYQSQEIKGIEVGVGKTAYCTLSLNVNMISCYEITYCCCFGGYNGYAGENWWPKLWTPYREMYKEWKEKKERKLAKKVKKNEIKLSEESDEHGIADSIETARIALVEEMVKEIKIYPNPATDVLHIESAQPLQNLIMRDGSGKIVKEEIMQSTFADIKLNDFSSGIYYLNYLANGKAKTKRVVVVNE